MANLTKRIIDLQTTSTLGSDDYVMVDGATNGTKKYLLKDVLDEIEDIEDGTALGTGAVTTDKLAAGAVTNAKIGDGAVDTTNIADDAVTAAKIADGAVGTDALAANAVTGAKIATGAIGTGNIASGAVTLDKIASDSNATSSRNGLMSSADKAKLDGFSAASNYALKSDIVGAYIFKGSVNTENDLPSTGLTVGDVYNIIAASSYGESGANVAWTGTAWDALGESFDISDGAIDTEQLANGAVTNDKLAEEAMTTVSPAGYIDTDPTYGSEIRQGYSVTFGNSDETVLLPHVGSDFLIDVENIPTIPEKRIGSGAITANKIAAGAVGTEKLANNAVNTDKLATAAVSTDKIASLAVTTNKIAAGAVDNSKLANNAVGTAQIVNGAVTSEKLGSDVTSTINAKAAASDVTALSSRVDGLAEEVDTKADQEYVDEELEYKADIDTIRRLPKEYQSHKSMGQLTAALESSLGVDITETWDEDDQRYEYEISDFELADGAVTPQSLSDDVTHGQYPSLSVGRADELTGADSTTQWAQRESAGSGAATVRSVQGAAVAWNQLCNWFRKTQTVNGVTFTNNGDGSVTLSGTATADAYLTAEPQVVSGHKYMFRGCPQGGSASTYYGYLTMRGLQPAVLDTGSGNFGVTNQDGDARQIIYVKSGTTCDNVTFWPQLFDLTAIFGAGNEPTTVAEFEAMYPASYYPYSAPTLKPVQIAGIQSTDAQGNALDSVEWTAQTLRAAGSVGDMLYSDHVDVRVGQTTVDGSGVGHWVYSVNVNDDVLRCRVYPAGLATISGSSANLVATGFNSRVGYNEPYDCYHSADALWFVLPTSAVSATTVAGANAWFAEHPTEVMFQLATPTTTPISPALPMTYRVEQGGTESIIVPTGEISAAPVLTVAEGESAGELVMDALACIAAPDGPVATANHAINTYLTYNGKLYKVTSAIVVGETITPNTNVTETTVMAELLALTQ